MIRMMNNVREVMSKSIPFWRIEEEQILEIMDIFLAGSGVK